MLSTVASISLHQNVKFLPSSIIKVTYFSAFFWKFCSVRLQRKCLQDRCLLQNQGTHPVITCPLLQTVYWYIRLIWHIESISSDALSITGLPGRVLVQVQILSYSCLAWTWAQRPSFKGLQDWIFACIQLYSPKQIECEPVQPDFICFSVALSLISINSFCFNILVRWQSSSVFVLNWNL